MLMRILPAQALSKPKNTPASWITRHEKQDWILSREGVFCFQSGSVRRMFEVEAAPEFVKLAGMDTWLDRSEWKAGPIVNRLPPSWKRHSVARLVLKEFGTSAVSLVFEEAKDNCFTSVYFRVNPVNCAADKVEAEMTTLLLGLKSC